jgi:Spy/CpxP family protein refolding chaperone
MFSETESRFGGKNGILMFLTALFVFVLTGFGFGQKQDHDRIQMRDNIIKELNLTDEQQTNIGQMRLQNQKDMVDLKADLQKKKIELKELLQNGNYSRTEYMTKTDAIISAKNNIEIAQAENQMDIYESLDADQQKIWNKKGHRFHDGREKFFRKEFRRIEHE